MEKLLIKRIGIFISILTFLMFCISIFEVLIGKETIADYKLNFVTLFFSMMFLISSFYLIGKYIQVGCICLTSIITLLTEPDIGYTIAQIIIIVFLSRKYGFFKKKLFFKVILSTIVFVILFLFSLIISPRPIYYIISTLLFFIIFGTFLYLIKLDDIKIYLENDKFLKEKIVGLRDSLLVKESIINNIDTDYINPIEAGLTNAELELLRNICTYRESNPDLAKRLKKSENTIKVQMKKILLKIGVESRYQLVDACKNYYLLHELK